MTFQALFSQKKQNKKKKNKQKKTKKKKKTRNTISSFHLMIKPTKHIAYSLLGGSVSSATFCNIFLIFSKKKKKKKKKKYKLSRRQFA